MVQNFGSQEKFLIINFPEILFINFYNTNFGDVSNAYSKLSTSSCSLYVDFYYFYGAVVAQSVVSSAPDWRARGLP